MWGAVIGDLAGSVYEYEQYKKVGLIPVNELITKDSFLTGNTILIIAVCDAIRSLVDYEGMLREYGNKYIKYRPQTSSEEIFPSAFGGYFVRWLKGENNGESIGNGAMMRISCIGKMFDTEEEVIHNVILATTPSHNTISAINCAKIVARVLLVKGF